tara:strand:+ start:49 stop:423 length:375 start_codon:yes stop_codon:yes gene_type:complete
MSTKQQSTAEVNVQILASLADGKWSYLNKISKEILFYVAGSRLKPNMTMLKNLGCILDTDDWEKLTNQQREEYLKGDALLHTSVKEKGAKFMYRITDTGREKFRKIQNDCLDDITRQILNIHAE